MVDENTNQKRQIAYKASIKDITLGEYFVEEGWNPNYILTDSGRKLARVNLIVVR